MVTLRFLKFKKELCTLYFNCFQVVCSKCLNQKIPLSYEDNKSCRVCRHCYEILSNCKSLPPSPSGGENGNSEFSGSPRSSNSWGKGVLEVRVYSKTLTDYNRV